MKKKVLKNVAILTFALFGLGIIGHNVAYATGPIHEGPGEICCIGDKFRIDPIPGGWECINDEGNSCCPIC